MKDQSTVHIQQFAGGLSVDDDIQYVKPSQYTYAENVRVMTNEGGTASSLQTIEGLYQYSEKLPDNRVILGVDVIKDYGVIITKVLDDSGNYS